LAALARNRRHCFVKMLLRCAYFAKKSHCIKVPLPSARSTMLDRTMLKNKKVTVTF